jgi:biopolymer transport protein ExbD
MKNWALFLISMSTCLMGCGQGHKADSTGVGNERLTCLVLGYDSLIYYSGTSKNMRDINKGRITDTTFMNAMFAKIKDSGLSMTLKPGSGAEVIPDFTEVVNLANLHQIYGRSVDSIDENEVNPFDCATAPQIKATMNGKDYPMKLALPRTKPDTPNAVTKFPKEAQLVILLSGSKDIYAYMGGDIRKGQKYTYQELTDMLKEKSSGKDFSVEIKPTKSSTYKSTVDMLDLMRIADIQHYALVDISKEEEDYLRQLGQG